MGIKVAFIGAGNMAEAMIKGLIASRTSANGDIVCTDVRKERLNELKSTYSVRTEESNAAALTGRDITVIAVKPQNIDEALKSLDRPQNMLFLSIAAGVGASRIKGFLGTGSRVVRCMPNAPALVGSAISALSASEGVSKEDLGLAQKLTDAFGETIVIKDEGLMDAVTGLSGSGPAYVALFIEALAEGGMLMGLDRASALKLAQATTLGAAKMLDETGKDPAELKAMVSSPGGTTIEGLAVLEGKGFKPALIEAVRAATNRSKELGR